MASSGANVPSFRQVRKEHAKAEATAATATPSLGVHPAEPLVDVVPPRVEKKNPSKDKDKGPKHRTTERMEIEAEAGMRAKKQKHLTPSFISPCTLPPALTSSSFLNPTINTREVFGQGFISQEGRNFLSQENLLTKWSLLYELMGRSMAIAQTLFMEPITEMDKLCTSLKNSEVALTSALSKNKELSAELDKLKAERTKLHGLVSNFREKLGEAEASKAKVVGEFEGQLEEVTAQRDKAISDYASYKNVVEERIYNEHEEGFNHAVRQAIRFLDVPSDFQFDLGKDFYKGNFMDLNDIPDEATTEDANTPPPSSLVAEDNVAPADVDPDA
ncbi:uncharacterized protein LOC114915224 [Cajanus cajan]|uniref:uncharacterized protein LOC114915224 n=1 Tax=Cajanus cajan TaxID=3821 RepID=UPI0010FB0E16|nr:uncharacterized protein LOC114915224 [Cajanus cajan]